MLPGRSAPCKCFRDDSGDISPADGVTSNGHVVWSNPHRGYASS